MYIEWENYKTSALPIDYYGITVKDGVVVKNRIYYIIDGSMVLSTNPLFDALTLRHLLKCFSVGKEENADYTKYDFKLNIENSKEVLTYIVSNLDFCSEVLLDDIQFIFSKYGDKFYFRILGTIINEKLKNINSACFYFYTHEKIDVRKHSDLIARLLDLCLRSNKVYEKICWPVCNENGYLCFIALDFSLQLYKIKFYFEFCHGYDQSLLLKVFEGTKAFNVVSDIVRSNARIDGFQVAVTENGQVSYNFYLQEQ